MGIGLTLDSINYISGAKNLMEGQGFLSYSNDPIIVYPPFYSVIIGSISIITFVEVYTASEILNALIFGTIIFFCGYYARYRLNLSKGVAIFCSLSVIVSIPLVYVASYALTELLFALLILFSIVIADKYLSHQSTKYIVYLGMLSSFAVMTKYIGITVFVWMSIVIMIANKNKIKVVTKHLAVFSTLSIIPFVLWLIRNYVKAGTLTGERAVSYRGIITNLEYTFSTIVNWFLPFKYISNDWYYSVSVVLCLSLLVFALIKVNWPSEKVYKTKIVMLLLFPLIYCTVLIYLATVTDFDPIGDRLLSPIFIPVLISLIYIISTALNRYVKSRLPYIGYRIGIGFLSLWLLYPAFIVYKTAKFTIENGRGYNSKRFKNSDLLNFISKRSDSLNNASKIIGNGPDLLFWKKGIESSLMFRNDREKKLDEYLNNYSFKNTYLIWFTTIQRDYLYTPEDLKKNNGVALSMVYSCSDGNIWLIKTK